MLLTGADNIDLVQAAPVLPDNRSGWTALHYMVEAEAQGVDVAGMVEELLAAGADPHQPDQKGDTAFNIAAPSSPITGRLMTKYWLEGKGTKGLNERSGSHGSTLAQYIAKWLHDDEIEAAVAKDIKFDLPNASGWTPLCAAAAMGRVKAVEVFAKSGHPAAQTTESYTANYHGSSVTYPAGLDAAGIAKVRLEQDRGLTAEMKKNLQQCIKILGG
jgi:ankyrin repeat protein